MNTLQQISFLYPNAVTVVVILIALLVIYFAGRALAWVFSSTEKKIEPEPSIMTELDELRRSNERLSTMYDQLAYDHNVLDNEYKKFQGDFNAHKSTSLEVLQSLNDSQAQSYDRMMRIAELEKELSDLRSSCDDSFLNTVERANQLSLKCASLENTIAEFDVYKKDAQEVHDRITKLYEAEVATKKELSSKLWRSRREVANLKRDLISATAQIAELGEKYRKADKDRADYEAMYASTLKDYAEIKTKYDKHNGWVFVNKDGHIYHHHKPIKVNGNWETTRNINQGVAWALCGRVPEMSDTEATVVTRPVVESKLLTDLSWVKWVAMDQTGDIWAYAEKPIKLNYSWEAADEGELITPVMAIVLCDRVPEWSDSEPTPVIKK